MQHQMTDAEQIRTFILAGNATITLVSEKTGKRYTFKVVRARNARNGSRPWFVSVLYGPDNTGDFTHIGTIFQSTTDNDVRMVPRFWTKRGGSQTDPRFAAFRFLLGCLDAGRIAAALQVWHEGRCGRCGRTLTVPESIEAGIGPECAEKMAA